MQEKGTNRPNAVPNGPKLRVRRPAKSAFFLLKRYLCDIFEVFNRHNYKKYFFWGRYSSKTQGFIILRVPYSAKFAYFLLKWYSKYHICVGLNLHFNRYNYKAHFVFLGKVLLNTLSLSIMTTNPYFCTEFTSR